MIESINIKDLINKLTTRVRNVYRLANPQAFFISSFLFLVLILSAALAQVQNHPLSEIRGPADVNLNITGVNITNISYAFFGNNSVDVYLYRGGTNILQTASNLVVDGTVGIGTSTPIRKLGVVGDVNFTGALYVANNTVASASNGTIYLGKTSGDGFEYIQFDTTLGSNGKFVFTAPLQIAASSPGITFYDPADPKNESKKESLNYDPNTKEFQFSGGKIAQDFTNLVRNGGFESFSGGTTGFFSGGTNEQSASPDGWILELGTAYQYAPGTYFVGTDIFQGYNSLKLNATSGGQGKIRQTISTHQLQPGKNYSVGVWVKIVGGVSAGLDVTGGGIVADFTEQTSSSTSWTLLKGQFRTRPTLSPTFTDNVTIELKVSGPFTPNNFALFDAVQMNSGGVIGEYKDSPIVDTGDQTIYGGLRLQRTGSGRGGILTADDSIRTRRITFSFGGDPGWGGSVDPMRINDPRYDFQTAYTQSNVYLELTGANEIRFRNPTAGTSEFFVDVQNNDAPRLGTQPGKYINILHPVNITASTGTVLQVSDTLYVDGGNKRVGIGTTAAAAKLDVSSGDSGTTAGELVVDTANKAVYVGRLSSVAGTSGKFVVRGRIGNEHFVADSNNGVTYFNTNVGIGTAAPVKKLDVVGDINATGNLFGALGWGNLTEYPGACPAGQAVTALGDTITCAAVAGGKGWDTSGSNVFNNTAGVQVGIGTASPRYTLDTLGIARIFTNNNINTSLTLVQTNASSKFLELKSHLPGVDQLMIETTPNELKTIIKPKGALEFQQKSTVTWAAKTAWDMGTDYGDYPRPAVADLDNDGDYDLMVGFDSGTTLAFENTGSPTSPTWTRKAAWDGPDVGTFSSPAFADLDNDGDYDVMIGEYAGTVFGYKNTGSATSPVWTANAGWNIATALGVSSFVSPGLADLDNDGDYDLMIGYVTGVTVVYQNTGSASSPIWTRQAAWDITIDGGDYGMPAFADLDNDGDYDTLLSVENDVASRPIQGIENTGTASAPTWAAKTAWNLNPGQQFFGVTVADLDNDGDYDALAARIAGPVLAYENTGATATPLYLGRNGNVGIGTTGPSTLLHVNNGAIRLDAGTTSGLSVYDAETTTGEVRLGAAWGYPAVYTGSTQGIVIGTEPTYPIQFTQGTPGTASNIKMVIDAQGEVGIGTTGPNRTLDVNGWIKTRSGVIESDTPSLALQSTSGARAYVDSQGAQIGLSNTAPGYGVIESAAAYDIHLKIDGSEKVTILDSGNVGINTTNPGDGLTWQSPGLDVKGARGTLNLQTTSVGGLSTIRFKGPSTSSEFHLNFFDGATAGMGLYSYQYTGGANYALYVTGPGNVGIGTTGPGARLTVAHPGTVNQGLFEGGWTDSLASNSRLRFNDGNFGIGAGKISATASNDALVLWSYGTTPRGILFASTNAGDTTTFASMQKNMWIDGATGNVGIGLTSPSAKLHVNTSDTTTVPFRVQSIINISLVSVTSATCSTQSQSNCAADDTANANNALVKDGAETAYIVANNGAAGTKTYTHTFDLSQIQTLTGVDLIGRSTGCWTEDGSNGGCVHNDNGFDFQYSADGSTYSSISATSSEACNRLDDGCWIKFNALQMRYLRLVVTSGCSGCSNNDYVDHIKLTRSSGDYIYVRPGGNVGIGTATPVQKLDVVGNLNVTGSVFTMRGISYTWPAADGSANQVLTTNGVGTLSWAAAAGGGKGWDTSGSVVFNNTKGLQVGINTSTPGAELEVNGGFRLNTTVSKPACADAVRGLFWFEKSASGTDDFVYACMRTDSGSFNWVMLARGD